MDNLHFEAVIQPWGNNMGLRITPAISKAAHLERGTVVTVAVVDGGLLVTPKPSLGKPFAFPYSEAELVQGLDPVKAHADELMNYRRSSVGRVRASARNPPLWG
ncbi:MAG: hypothetical protein ACOYMW_01245 [Candidatus Competibacteraceae bacterium]